MLDTTKKVALCYDDVTKEYFTKFVDTEYQPELDEDGLLTHTDIRKNTMKTAKPTEIELQEKIEVIAAISFEVLNIISAKELKEYAKHIVPNSSKLAKEDLIKGLLEVTLTARQKLIKADELKQVELATEAEKAMIEAHQDRINKENQLNEVTLPDSVLIALDNNNESRQEIDAEKLFNVFLAVLETPEKFKWTEIVKALAFFTGRRTSEILCSAEFVVVDNHHLTFKGQAKRRQNFNPDESFTIPTLVDTGLIMAAFNYLIAAGKRQLYNVNDHQGSLEMCNKKTSKELSRSYTNYTAKDYRAMYGELTYLVFATNEIGQTIWFTKVLGHGDGAEAWSASYVRYYLPDEKVESFKKLVLSN